MHVRQIPLREPVRTLDRTMRLRLQPRSSHPIASRSWKKNTNCSAARWTISTRPRLKARRNIVFACRESRFSICFENRGNVASIGCPGLVTGNPDIFGSSNSFGGSLRQSQFGLEVIGPTLAGARTRGEVQFDFAGGFPDAPNGVTLGIMRLRTGTIHMDWATNFRGCRSRRAILFAALADVVRDPGGAGDGICGKSLDWMPQVTRRAPFRSVRKLHNHGPGRNSRSRSLEKTPYSVYSNYSTCTIVVRRQENSLVSLRMRRAAAWSTLIVRAAGDGRRRRILQPSKLGLRTLRQRLEWYVDWIVPFGKGFTWSGEFYRGQALGGLGGGALSQRLFSGSRSTLLRRHRDSIRSEDGRN